MAELLNKTDAQILVNRIRNEMGSLRRNLVALRDGRGWEVLGYKSLRECLKGEFGESLSRLYRELQAADVEANLSPIGDNGWLPESHARKLSSLEPEQQISVYQHTKEEAEEEGKEVTASALHDNAQIFAKLNPEQQRALIEEEERQALAKSQPKEIGGANYNGKFMKVQAYLSKTIVNGTKAENSGVKLEAELKSYGSEADWFIEETAELNRMQKEINQRRQICRERLPELNPS